MKFFRNNSFLIIVILNVILKILFLGSNPYSFDEIISVKDTLLEFGHIKHEAEWDNNPPFYYYCLWIWHAILPIGEFNSRLLSVVFVALAIGLIFIFTKRYFDQTLAVFVTIYLTLSNFLHFYSQEARAYSLVILLAISSTIFYFKCIEKSKISDLIWISLLNFLLIYTHYISALIVVVQYVLYPFLTSLKSRKYYFVQSGIITVLIFWRFTTKQYLNIIGFNKNDDFWLKKTTALDLLESLKLLYGGPIILILFSLGFMFFILRANKLFFQNKAAIYCFSVSFLSTIILFVIGLFKPVFLARYLIFTIPFSTILVFYVFSLLNRTKYLLFGIIMSVSIFQYKKKKDIEVDYRFAAAVLDKVRQNQDKIIINRADNLLAFTYYYDRVLFLTGKEAKKTLEERNIFGSNSSKETLNSTSPGTIIFLFQSYHKIFDPENSFRQELISQGKLLYKSNYINGIELSVIKRL